MTDGALYFKHGECACGLVWRELRRADDLVDMNGHCGESAPHSCFFFASWLVAALNRLWSFKSEDVLNTRYGRCTEFDEIVWALRRICMNGTWNRVDISTNFHGTASRDE